MSQQFSPSIKHLTSIILVASLVLLTSCHARKGAVVTSQNGGTSTEMPTTTDIALRLDAIVASTGAWTTLKASGNISISGGTSFSSAVQVRMVRDQALYISLRPLLGIEAGRLIIRGDSLYVVNKLQKQYLAEKVSLLTAGIPATVGMMQDMFLGRPFVMGEGSLNASRKQLVTITPAGNGCTIAPITQPRDFSYAFSCNEKNQVTSLDVRLTRGGTAYSMTYGDVQRTLAGNIAHALQLVTDIKGKAFRLKLDYGDITWNEAVDTSFSIPAGYQRINAQSLFGLFGQ
ncbi:MAG: DUF4292 domain-containing protein [Muribaculaceae bacterium]|nr:DUF4292 domain-containing protein [Muribaculaceae bacterium]